MNQEIPEQRRSLIESQGLSSCIGVATEVISSGIRGISSGLFSENGLCETSSSGLSSMSGMSRLQPPGSELIELGGEKMAGQVEIFKMAGKVEIFKMADIRDKENLADISDVDESQGISPLFILHLIFQL